MNHAGSSTTPLKARRKQPFQVSPGTLQPYKLTASQILPKNIVQTTELHNGNNQERRASRPSSRGGQHNEEIPSSSANSSIVTNHEGTLGGLEELHNKFNALRRENKQLRGMLKQNELIMQSNLSQIKSEKNATSKLLPTLLPIAQKFSIKVFKNGSNPP